MIEVATALALGVMGQLLQDFALSGARGWVQEHETEVIQDFLPIDGYRIIVARSLETLPGEIPEQWFCIDYGEDGGFVAEVRLPDKQPIIDQLAWSHLSDPHKP